MHDNVAAGIACGIRKQLKVAKDEWHAVRHLWRSTGADLQVQVPVSSGTGTPDGGDPVTFLNVRPNLDADRSSLQMCVKRSHAVAKGQGDPIAGGKIARGLLVYSLGRFEQIRLSIVKRGDSSRLHGEDGVAVLGRGR